jgi:hypothetical protein
MSNTWHRGHRAARRAGRRRRNWIVAAVVGGLLVLALGGFAAATVLADHGDAEVATTVTTPPTGAPVAVVGSTVSTAPPLPCRAGLTPEVPLRLWIAGDSIAYSVGNGLGAKAADTGVVAPVYESRVSSGLSTPGFFDWPARVGEELARLDPEVVVFVMGTNDWAVPQETPVDATGAPAWKADYAQGVADVVAELTAGGRVLYWVGPPVLEDEEEDAGVRAVAAVIRDVVERSPNAEFVDAHALFADADGSYTANLEIDGKKVTVRAGDGVHLTTEGADYVGAALFDRLDAQCRLGEQVVKGVTQPVVETQGSTSVAPGSTAPPATSPPTVAASTAPTAAPVPQTTPPTTATPATTIAESPTAPPSGE